MHVRLAFSVAIQVDAEILLIDEVLAVGDARFQQKCFDEFQRLKRERRTILFVTHDMNAIERFCDRAMLLDKGRMIAIGDPAAIARRYNRAEFRTDDSRHRRGPLGDGGAPRQPRRGRDRRRLVREHGGRADPGDRPPRVVHRLYRGAFHRAAR